MSATPPICDFGWKAPDFSLFGVLAGIDDKTYTLGDVRGEKGTLIMFICNHCPYVRGIISRLTEQVKELQGAGIGVVAIMANDWQNYPADSFDNMKLFADENGFTFPYVIDENQQVARSYDAICTPDFFGFNADDELQYRGRMDASRTELVEGGTRDLVNAMVQIAQTGKGPSQQIASMGCSIKWRDSA